MKKDWSEKRTLVLLAAALGMCLCGAFSGEAYEVLMKAVRICMECIGLG